MASLNEAYVVIRDRNSGLWFAYTLRQWQKRGHDTSKHTVYGRGDSSIEALGDLLESNIPRKVQV